MERISSKMVLTSSQNLSKNIPYIDPTDVPSSHDCCEIATDLALKNISSMLFEENIDENSDEGAALETVEKSFYDILVQKYPSNSPSNVPQSNSTQGSTITFSDVNNEISFPAVEFNKGVEEGMKFLPGIDKKESAFYLQANKPRMLSKNKMNSNLVGRKLKEDEEEDRDSMILLWGKRCKNYRDMSPVDGRNCKISVLHFSKQEEVFDRVVLLDEGFHANETIRLREIKQKEMKLHDKKQNYENLVDLRGLLIQCSQAISINDTICAHQLIKQIRNHSSPDGNGVQRLAHIFVNGLEARLKGVGREILVLEETISDSLNMFHMFLISNPFLFAPQYFANHTILNTIGNASKVHIIHFGIEFGFHWPYLMKALSQRIGGPPKIRITGIGCNLSPGFSANARLDATGKMLEGYSRIFDVPFEYKGLGDKWDEICIEDLNIEKDEVIIVSCLHGMEALGDETDVMYSPKNRLLDIIRQIKPNVFIQGIINASYSGSIFADRFKQLLLQHSAIFSMFDNTIPQGNNKLRWYLENHVFGRVAVNVIAYEGSKRFMRPETYKQWHARNLRAGYDQLPLDHTITERIKGKVREVYNKDFFVEDDNEWLLLGWKGRVICGLSTWRPKNIYWHNYPI